MLAVGRASVGIYSILKTQCHPSDAVLVPANICYAAIYPILYANLHPVFCDVDLLTGNITWNDFIDCYTPDIKVVIIPHMYGNPVYDLLRIAEFCKLNHILLIEDCASAMGAQSEHYELGSVGDYCIYSTGYSKTLDLGSGGFVCCDNRASLAEIEAFEKTLPAHDPKSDDNQMLFSKIYRLLRNEGHGTPIERMIYRELPVCCINDFVFRIDQSHGQWLYNQLGGLNEVIFQRRQKAHIYDHALADLQSIHYPYEVGAVPWRYNILVRNKNARKLIITHCLEAHLPVSDWYPNVTPMFGVDKRPKAAIHEQWILNFPLLISDEQIQKICAIIRNDLTVSA